LLLGIKHDQLPNGGRIILMIKALLVVTTLVANPLSESPLFEPGPTYNTILPSMESCLEARNSILKQDKNLRVLCIPKEDKEFINKTKMKDFFAIFIRMIDQLRVREREEIDRQSNDKDRFCSDCAR